MLIFGILSIVSNTHAQTAILSGTIRDSVTLEPLVAANIILVESSLGTVSSSEGAFRIEDINPGLYTISTSLVGYATREHAISIIAGDSLFLELQLPSEHVEEEEVVVTGTRTAHSIADVPVRVEAIQQEEVEEKLLMAPSSVTMLLNESTGMRMQTTSATSNTANLRIQGLSGRYAQILTDGIPSFGGLSAGFGLTQLPPLNLRQVEVIKGATSALYGPDAISGVINFITKKPKPEPELSTILNTTTQGGLDIAAYYSKEFDDIGMTILGSRNTQRLFDVDSDGFGDVAGFERYSVYPKIFFSPSENVSMQASLGILHEDRHGGATNAPASAGTTGIPYVEEIKSRRVDLSAKLHWMISEHEAVAVTLAEMTLRRDALYGNAPFQATQNIFYADALYSFGMDSHFILLGGALNVERFIDRTPAVPSDRSYRYTVPAFFAQDEITFSEYWTMLLSGRVDVHNTFGTFVTPRASLMYRPIAGLTMRIGGGTGFKSPTIFVEQAEESGFHNVRPLQNALAEEATSASFDLNWRGILGEVGANFNLALYASKLSHAILADKDSLDDGILFLRSASGSTQTRGGEFSARLSYSDFNLSLGYTYLYATQHDNSETYELDLNPRHSFGAVIVWENHQAGAKIGIENYWIGSQRLDRTPFRDRSPEHWITGMTAEKSLGHFRVFVNLENIFDTRQTRYEPIIVGNPSAGTFRALPIYAPLEGRVINGGIRFVL